MVTVLAISRMSRAEVKYSRYPSGRNRHGSHRASWGVAEFRGGRVGAEASCIDYTVLDNVDFSRGESRFQIMLYAHAPKQVARKQDEVR